MLILSPHRHLFSVFLCVWGGGGGVSKKLLLAEEISIILCVFLRSVGRCFLVKLVGHYSVHFLVVNSTRLAFGFCLVDVYLAPVIFIFFTFFLFLFLLQVHYCTCCFLSTLA